MLPTVTLPVRPSRRGEPVWELIELFPEQGEWSEEGYLRLNTNRLVEFEDGCIRVLPMPDIVHQLLVLLFSETLKALVINGRKGVAVPAPFKLKVRNGKWREPDVCYLLPENVGRVRRKGWDYADLAIEIISDDDPNRDYVEKRADYAALGVPEYWIADPRDQSVVVLVLEGHAYREAQVARPGDVVRSVTVPGLAFDVTHLYGQAMSDLPE